MLSRTYAYIYIYIDLSDDDTPSIIKKIIAMEWKYWRDFFKKISRFLLGRTKI